MASRLEVVEDPAPCACAPPLRLGPHGGHDESGVLKASGSPFHVPAVEVVELAVVVVRHAVDDVVQLEIRISELAPHRQQQVVAGIRAFRRVVSRHAGGKALPL